MDETIKKELGVSSIEPFGGSAGGCISRGGGYHAGHHGDVFIKFNDKSDAKRMFDGEYASLDAMYATHSIRVPKPIKSISEGGRSCLITEYISLNGPSVPAQLGTDLAKMHIHNADLLAKKEHDEGFIAGDKKDSPEPVMQFGFEVPTCCGYLPQNNEWSDDWVLFYTRNRLKHQIDMLLEKKGDRELLQLWPELERKIPSYFKECDTIIPSLVHGDLWSGNYAYCETGPVIFDPASFYAHNEYEMGIMSMFGGFGSSVYSAYHEVIPRQKGADKRIQLYELYHHLNHWNHFGSGYRGGSLSIIRSLI